MAFWGKIDGTDKWYKEYMKRSREGYVPIKKD